MKTLENLVEFESSTRTIAIVPSRFLKHSNAPNVLSQWLHQDSLAALYSHTYCLELCFGSPSVLHSFTCMALDG